MNRKKIPLFIQILAGMVLGVLFGGIVSYYGASSFIIDWVKPFGEIFIRLLKLIAIPLILISLIKGVGSLNDIQKLSRMGIKTLGIYLLTTIAAIVFGLCMAYLVSPGKMVDQQSMATIQKEYNTVVIEKSNNAELLKDTPPLQPLVDVIPDNLFGAMGTNQNMLQIIFIALLIGIAIVMCGQEKSKPFMKLIDSLDHIIMKVIDLIMLSAPVGVFALMAGLIADNAGHFSILGALGLYALTVAVSLLILIFVFYPALIYFFTKLPPNHFIRTMIPVQLLAFSTSSSAATLPVTMEKSETDLGIPNDVASFVLPVGVTINMDGTSCYQAIAVVFIAQVMGVDLSWLDLLTIVATTTISSIGTPGIPGGSVVILMMVLTSVGIPAEGLALILGIDRPLDMLRTAVNVTGDVTVASIVAKPKM